MKNPSWNSAFIGTEDWTAITSSEVFRNYVSAQLAIDREKDEKEKEEGCDDAVKQPLRQNLDYKGAKDCEINALIAFAENIDPKLLQELDDELDEAETEMGKDNFELNDGSPYETSAGESKFIEIGVTDTTMRQLEDGIDYADDNPYFNSTKTSENEAVGSVMDIYNKEEDKGAKEAELEEAEKDLGLNMSAAYALSKLRK